MADISGQRDARRHVLRGLAVLAGMSASDLAAANKAVPPEPSPPPVTGVDPRDYGAKFDGSSDDSAALRAAALTKRAVLIEGVLRIDQVVDLPYDVALIGVGRHRSRIVMGPKGKLRIAGESFKFRGGGALIRDLTIAPVERANNDHAIEMRHAEHNLLDNVTFYLVSMLLDDHHYVTFRDCYFFGEPGKSSVVSHCVSQPAGHAAISECLVFTGCFFAANPVLLEDTVGPKFTDCIFFGGDVAIRSTRRLARGSASEPFFMGPVISGCMFDSINGSAVEIEGGGTDCRLVNNFISGGRPTQKPGMVLTASSGVELVGNRFEWCGSAGLVIDDCEKIGVVSNSFANIAAGPAISTRRSRGLRVVANAFENKQRWGGSAEGFTTLAIDDAGGKDAGTGWVVMGNTASGLRDPRVSTLRNSLVHSNPGWPPSTEQGWPAGDSAARPRGVQDGYRWYDQGIGEWLHWHQNSGRWRTAAGRAL